MRLKLTIILLLLFTCFVSFRPLAQIYLSGTVYDSSKINMVPDVRVVSSGGLFAITDSMGRYNLTVSDKDSVSFIYRNKPTQKFAVRSITDPSHFDIALRVTYKGKYSFLKEVVVFSKPFRQDSIENREAYSDVFNHKNAVIKSSMSPDGVAGMDLDEFINAFRFKRNKRLKAFRIRLEQEEQEKYVNYRFNKNFVRKLTHLQGAQLDSFMVLYRPPYEWASNADELSFNQYILNCSYQYKIDLLRQTAKKDAP